MRISSIDWSRLRGWLIVACVMVAAIAALVWLARTIWPDDEGRIRGQLTRLAEAVSFDQTPSPLGSVARGRRAAQAFTSTASVSINFGGLGNVEGQNAIAALAAQACQLVSSVRVSFPDSKIVVSGDSAMVEATGVATGKSRSGESFREVREFRMRCLRDGGGWLIASVEEVQPVVQ